MTMKADPQAPLRTNLITLKLLEIARAKLVQAAKRVGIALRQTFVKEGKELRRKAGGYAHAKQFKRLRRTVERQRTILGIVLRETERKLATAKIKFPSALTRLNTLLACDQRIRTQQGRDKNKLYALHAPEVYCISKGKARKSYEFGVMASIAVKHKSGLMVGARTSGRRLTNDQIQTIENKRSNRPRKCLCGHPRRSGVA